MDEYIMATKDKDNIFHGFVFGDDKKQIFKKALELDCKPFGVMFGYSRSKLKCGRK